MVWTVPGVYSFEKTGERGRGWQREAVLALCLEGRRLLDLPVTFSDLWDPQPAYPTHTDTHPHSETWRKRARARERERERERKRERERWGEEREVCRGRCMFCAKETM